jgi:hypothetical protein
MSCPKTPHLLQAYFAEDLSTRAGQEIQKHLDQCAHCSAELNLLLTTRDQLEGWQEQAVPHWDRGMELFRREHRSPAQAQGFFGRWQWFPTAASFAMLCLMLFNTTIVADGNGVSISFGAAGGEAQMAEAMEGFKQQFSEQINEQQQLEREALMARFEARQDSNNVQLLEAVMQQSQQATAENMELLYSYFEQQRLQDLQAMRAGYQELLDSDYQTIRSLQQLAQYVSYDDTLVPQ